MRLRVAREYAASEVSEGVAICMYSICCLPTGGDNRRGERAIKMPCFGGARLRGTLLVRSLRSACSAAPAQVELDVEWRHGAPRQNRLDFLH